MTRQGAEGSLVVVQRVPYVLTTKTSSWVLAHRGNMISGEAVEAQADEIAGDWHGGSRSPVTGLGPLALEVTTMDFMPAISL